MLNIEQFYEKLRDKKPLSNDEVLELLAELKHFRGIASYLASCHAATAEGEGMLKKTSHSSRGRFAGICKSAALMLQMKSFANHNEAALDAAVRRCEQAAQLLESVEK